MTNKVLITGASGNIGTVLCDLLASKGYALILSAKTRAKLIALQSIITEKYNISAEIACIDYSNPESFIELTRICQHGINGLVLMPPKIPPTDTCFPTDQEWERVFKQSFIGPLALIRSLIPCLSQSKNSKVVIVSGISSVQPLMNYCMNNAIRPAWLGQTKTLALTYGNKGIHFNTISFGGIETNDFKAKVLEEAAATGVSYEEIINQKTSNIPLKKYATLTESAIVIEGLLSNFSDHLTGHNLMCDGGFIRTY